MTAPISRRDWELLSAYLDEALDSKQRANLVARLESDSELLKALDELGSTRQLLRLAPQARPPRHFTLTREMLAERQGFWSQAFSWNLLSAAATIMLVIVIIGDIGSSFGLPLAARAPSMTAQDALQADAAEMEKAASPVPAALGQAAAEPAADAAEAVDAEEAPEAALAEAEADSPATEGEADAERQTAEDEAASEAPAADQLGEAANAADEADGDFADDAADDAPDVEMPGTDSDDALQANPTAADESMEQGAAVIEQPAADQSEAATEKTLVEDQPLIPRSLVFRAAELFLAGLAIVSVLAARQRRAQI